MLEINLIGTGPGNLDLLTREAEQAIEKSTILAGDKRMLKEFTASGKKLYTTYQSMELKKIARQADPEKDVLSILVSGDVGFYSLAQSLQDWPGCHIRRYPGISSLVYFAARLSMSWEDAKLLSLHGRTQNLLAAVWENAKTFILTGGSNTPASICQTLCAAGLGKVQVWAGEDLSYPEEKISSGSAEQMGARSFSPLTVLMVLNPEAEIHPRQVHGLDDALFIRGQVPMTKQAVRSVALSKLQPAKEDIIYDVGAGTGSCSVELARLACWGRVYALEKNPEALALLRQNKERFQVSNLEIVAGQAAETIKELPAPAAVFVGGSGGSLAAILDLIYAKNVACRVVVTAITLETLAAVAAYYQDKTAYTLEVVNLSVAESQLLGHYHLMKAQNPVYIMTAVKKSS